MVPLSFVTVKVTWAEKDGESSEQHISEEEQGVIKDPVTFMVENKHITFLAKYYWDYKLGEVA